MPPLYTFASLGQSKFQLLSLKIYASVTIYQPEYGTLIPPEAAFPVEITGKAPDIPAFLPSPGLDEKGKKRYDRHW